MHALVSIHANFILPWQTEPIIIPTYHRNMAAVQTTPHFSNPMHCAALGQDDLPKSGFFRRLSQWFWPVAYYKSDYDEYNVTSPPRIAPEHSASPLFDISPGLQTQSGADDTNSPCKTCRMAGIPCDGQRPHCSQCLSEQTLCFYVDPLRVSKKKRKQSTAAQSRVLPSLSEDEEEASCAS